jgi:hypothetical protein
VNGAYHSKEIEKRNNTLRDKGGQKQTLMSSEPDQVRSCEAMKYIKISSEALDLLKEMLDLAEKVMGGIDLSKNPEMAPIDLFLYSFLKRAVNTGKSTVLLIEDGLYQDAWVIARIAFEGWCYILKFSLDHSLADKWTSFYVFEKYKEEYGFHGKGAAEKLLTKYPPEAVTKAKAEFEDAFENPEKRGPEWHKYDSFKKLVDELVEKKIIDKKTYSRFYGAYSKVVHWTPLGIVDADTYMGAVIGTTFLCVIDTAEAVNIEFVLPFGNDLANIRSRYIECASRSTQG